MIVLVWLPTDLSSGCLVGGYLLLCVLTCGF